MNFQPLGKRVLVQRLEEATKTASGIIIPDNAKEKPSSGTVVAVSTEVENVSTGDTVVFGKYAGNELTLEGKGYLVIETDDLLGIIK
ncbi:MAG: co-chaperone GroES [Sulfuricurvum sp.]|uniref:co-chaperone GroES n=1 Tax=Sulfuricurvum sp. TaxID=2025608 RepID=UPI00271840CA|nr:co-chaperone GroES [Sulfuricurvum sp.]MDO9056709.1 co-chaperone GroES [Sulfuricurvum sp.]MDP2850611.1 co-chaperone GroES [Sulfuricurvum sp.]MDP3291584.1 co-chaperone GroES [Sulfuricurvum sp.]